MVIFHGDLYSAISYGDMVDDLEDVTVDVLRIYPLGLSENRVYSQL